MEIVPSFKINLFALRSTKMSSTNVRLARKVCFCLQNAQKTNEHWLKAFARAVVFQGRCINNIHLRASIPDSFRSVEIGSNQSQCLIGICGQLSEAWVSWPDALTARWSSTHGPLMACLFEMSELGGRFIERRTHNKEIWFQKRRKFYTVNM